MVSDESSNEKDLSSEENSSLDEISAVDIIHNHSPSKNSYFVD